MLKPIFAQVLGWNGATVSACARVGWSGGHPSTVLPVVQSQCAWDDTTAKGTDFPTAPPCSLDGSGVPATSPLPRVPVAGKYVSMVLLKTKNEKVDGTKKCGSGGPDRHTPGNFGWLDSTGRKTCSVDLTSDKGTISAGGKPGTSVPSGWPARAQGQLGSIVYIPIFTSVDRRGADREHTIHGVSAFYLAGQSAERIEEDWDLVASLAADLHDAHARLVDFVATVLADGSWPAPGLRSPEHWLMLRAGLSRGQAAAVILVGRRADELPATAAALREGRISLDQAAVVARHTPAEFDATVAEFAQHATVTQLQRSVSRYDFTLQPDSVDDQGEVLPVEAGSAAEGGFGR